MVNEPEVTVFVSAQWDVPNKQHGAGIDGQFETVAQASRFILEMKLNSATIKSGAHAGTLIERDGVRGWHFPTLDQFIPLEG